MRLQSDLVRAMQDWPQDSHVVTWPAGDQEKHDSLGLLLRAPLARCARSGKCSGALPREHKKFWLENRRGASPSPVLTQA